MQYLLLATFCLVACVTTPQKQEAAKIAQVTGDAFQRTILEQSPVSGFSVAVYHQGKMLFTQSYGDADVDSRAPITADTTFRIASITKQFTAAAIMLLVEDGRVNLDAPLQTYLPEYPEFGKEITIRRLLNHTSGIGDYFELTAWPDMENRPLSRRELVKSFSTLPLLFPPGEQWYYSNSGYYLLGLVIEKVSQLSYAEFIQQRLIARAHLRHTFYCPPTQDAPLAAKGYRTDKDRLLRADPYLVDHAYAAGALCSTAQDLVQWNEALVQGEIIQKQSYQLMTTSPYGFGLEIGQFLGHRMISHAGDIKGFHSQLTYFPDDQLTIAIVTNTENFYISRLTLTIARIVRGLLQDLPVSREEAEKIQGIYTIKEFGGSYTITGKDQQLFALWTSEDGATKTPIRLLSQGDGNYWIAEKGMNFRFDSGRRSLTIQVDNAEVKSQ